MASPLELSLRSLHPFLDEHDTTISYHVRVKSYSHDAGSGPVLCMVHGYPQSAYMWRHVVPLLKQFSMFIPELPGYGISSKPHQSDKRTVGMILMEALRAVFGPDRPVIWCGHDRGARVGHRLLVDSEPEHKIIASILMDIVPTLEQWRAFANPRAAVAYYHWSFLATPAAPQLIGSMGGQLFCQENIERARGVNASGVALLLKDSAVEHYCALFGKRETISGSCADYVAGATDDVQEQETDQSAGRKVTLPTMVIYSARNLGSMHDVPAIWKKWVDGTLECAAISNDYGHYLPEEDPQTIADLVAAWVEAHSK